MYIYVYIYIYIYNIYLYFFLFLGLSNQIIISDCEICINEILIKGGATEIVYFVLIDSFCQVATELRWL